MRDRGYTVEVVAAHPHYPLPQWGKRALPYRERRDGITVLRLPLWIGRRTAAQRMLQEASFVASLSAVMPALGRPDAIVVVSPLFSTLLPAILNGRLRKVPWILWLHDLLPDGAVATGLIDEGGLALKAARGLERAAYREADRIVVLSRAFANNLEAKNVDERKLRLVYDPATRGVDDEPQRIIPHEAPRILSMGNIGRSQGLAPLVGTFDRSPEMRLSGARLIVTGDGVAADEARQQISSGLVEMLGVVSDDVLERELRSATLGLVSQRHEGAEFNLPSKLMNFMGYGIPVIAAVNPASEVARLVGDSGGGWIVDSSRPELFPKAVAEALSDEDELTRRSRAAHRYASSNFSRSSFAEQFDQVVRDVLADLRSELV